MITLKEVNNLKKTAKIVTFHQKQIYILVSNLLSKPLFLSKISSYIARFLKKKKRSEYESLYREAAREIYFLGCTKIFSLQSLYCLWFYCLVVIREERRKLQCIEHRRKEIEENTSQVILLLFN